MISTRRYFSLFMLLCLILSGCSSSGEPVSTHEPASSSVRWIAPTAVPALSEKAQSLQNALTLCQEFTQDMTVRYPAYAPMLPDADISYYEQRISSPNSDFDSLSAEMVKTISDLRQQTYLAIENTRKMDNPLPTGLENFVRDYEDKFHEIGW